MIKTTKPSTIKTLVGGMGRMEARSEPPASSKLSIKSGSLVKSFVEKFEKKSQSPSSNYQEQDRLSIVEPIVERQSPNNDETYSFSRMQEMKFFTDTSVGCNADSTIMEERVVQSFEAASLPAEFPISLDSDATIKERSADPTSNTPSVEFQTSFDFPDPFLEHFDPFKLKPSAKSPQITGLKVSTNVCSPRNEMDRELVLSVMSKMEAKFRQKVSIYGDHKGDEQVADEFIEINGDPHCSRICLAPSSISICSHFTSPRTVQRPRTSTFNPDVQIKSPSARERPHISVSPDFPLSGVSANSPDPGKRTRVNMIPDLTSNSFAVNSASTSTDWSPSICLSPSNDSKAFNSVPSPTRDRKPRISMVSNATTPKTPGRRRIALAPLSPTNESPNHPLSNRVKVLTSPDDMKRIRLSLSTGEKLKLDASSCLRTSLSGGLSGNPKRIAVRNKMNGAKKIICIESLQALLSQQVHPSAPTQETRSMSTPRQGLRRTSLTMTPNTTHRTKARVAPEDVTAMKEDPYKSGFQQQHRRHSFFASSRGFLVDDAASVEHGFDVITDRAGQAIAPPNKTISRRKNKKRSKRDAV
jgi:hypothetical protein